MKTEILNNNEINQDSRFFFLLRVFSNNERTRNETPNGKTIITVGYTLVCVKE